MTAAQPAAAPSSSQQQAAPKQSNGMCRDMCAAIYLMRSLSATFIAPRIE